MKIVCEIGNKFPKTCEDCKLFVSELGNSAYCVVGGEYTDEEIESEEDGDLDMYYHGCLESRPKNCPLKEVENENH